jgi:hypothetical protein
MSDAHALVDAVAADLDRPVGVDDRRFRPVAYSSQPDQVDQVRVASILRRQAPAEVTQWLESLGIERIEGHVRVPTNSKLGMAARVCIPLRFDANLLGYLWLIDEPTPLSEEQLALSLRYAQDLGVALYRARRIEYEERDREAVAWLLRGGERGEEPRPEGPLVKAPFYTVIALAAKHERTEPITEAIRALLADAADQVRREMDPGRLLVDVSGEQVLCVLAGAVPEEGPRRAAGLAAAGTRSLSGQDRWSVRVGVGAVQDELGGLPRAADQAREALRVADAVGHEEPLIEWERLGSYRTIVSLLGSHDPDAFLPDSFRRLLASGDGETLVLTLERYLDLGGDARAAAEALFLHRSSLYGRLRRIEEAAGVDLGHGEDRLELHLALKLWRLAGDADAGGDAD